MTMKNRYDFSGQTLALTCGNCDTSMELVHMGFMMRKSIYHFHCDCGAVTTLHWFKEDSPLPVSDKEVVE